jgi:ABC-type nitrate/sulfonate/bicarbonate transport system substrate-binding protein
MTNVTFDYVGAVATFAPEMLIQSDPSMCGQFNVNPQTSNVAPAAAAPALIANQINIVVQGAGSYLISAYKSPGQSKLVGAVGPTLLDLFAGKAITKIADLKGKTVGASAQGALSDLALREALSEDGLVVGPGKEVSMTYTGTSAAEFGLAESGAIAAFVQVPPLPAEIASHSIHSLEGLASDPNIRPLMDDPIGVNASYLAQHPDVVRGVLACVNKANQMAINNPNAAATQLAKAQQVDQATALSEINVSSKGNCFRLFAFETSDVQKNIDALEKFGIQSFTGFNPASVIDDALLPSGS